LSFFGHNLLNANARKLIKVSKYAEALKMRIKKNNNKEIAPWIFFSGRDESFKKNLTRPSCVVLPRKVPKPKLLIFV